MEEIGIYSDEEKVEKCEDNLVGGDQGRKRRKPPDQRTSRKTGRVMVMMEIILTQPSLVEADAEVWQY